MAHSIDQPSLDGASTKIPAPAHHKTFAQWIKQKFLKSKSKGQAPSEYTLQQKDLAQRLQLASSSAHLGIWDWDLKNNIMIWDDRMLELYGLSRQNFAGGVEAWQNGLHPEDRERAIEECQAALRGEKVWDTEFRILRRDNSILYIKANGVVLRAADGTPERMLGVNADITDRKKLDAALSEKQQLLVESQEVAQLGSWTLELPSYKMLWSRQNFRNFGLSTDSSIPTFEAFLKLLHPDDQVAMQAWTNACLTGTCPEPLEFRVIHPDGTPKVLEGRGKVDFDADGRPCRIFGTALDITVRKQLEDRVKQANREIEAKVTERTGELLRQNLKNEMILRSASDGIHILNARGDLLQANDAFYRMLGYRPEEMNGMNVAQWDAQSTPDELRAMVQNLIKEGRLFETKHRRHDGTLIDVEINAVGVRIDGESTLYASARDITHRKQIEAELKRSQERMARAQSLARMGDWEHDLVTNKVTWSEEMFRLFGFPPGDPKATYQNFVEHVHPDDRQAVMDLTANAAREAKPCATEYRLIRDDGKTVYFHATAEAILDKNGRPSRLIGSAQDISDLKELERERTRLMILEKEARAASEKANLVKDEFLATLSHELRTPLTTILSWSQLLLRGTLDADKTRHGLEVLEQSAKAQGQLIEDLLDISRIQAGKLHLDVQKIDPRKVITAAIDLTRTLAKNKSIQIDVTVDPAITHVFADPIRLQQILWNLITNSIKFSPREGRIWITVDHLIADSLPRVRFQVRDIGKGIKTEFIPHIFERFTQIDSTSTRSYGGLGLGLAIVRNLVQMHEGRVEVESAGEGKGATFSVYLPEQPATQVSPSEVASEADSEVTLKDVHILLVDDESSTREVFAATLESYGAKVKTAASAAEALTLVQEVNPDVLVSDIAMPLEDGYSLICKVRALDSHVKKVPAIALTAYAGQEDIRRALDAGFQCHVAKPVDGARLARAIASLVGTTENMKARTTSPALQVH